MRDRPIWDGYQIYDENGVCGVREDAPEEVKKAFAEYLKEEEEAKKKGLCLMEGSPERKMTEAEFRELAKKAGYDEEEIQALVGIHEESGIPFEEIPLIEKRID